MYMPWSLGGEQSVNKFDIISLPESNYINRNLYKYNCTPAYFRDIMGINKDVYMEYNEL